MAVIFPASPVNGDRVILAGREYQYASPKWKRFKSVVIDAGFSGNIAITLDEQTIDGGDADGI